MRKQVKEIVNVWEFPPLIDKNSPIKQKIIRKLLKNLEIISIDTDTAQDDYLGELLQQDYQQLITYYSTNDEMLKDLQDKIVKIQKQQYLHYNQQLAIFICRQLLYREKKINGYH